MAAYRADVMRRPPIQRDRPGDKAPRDEGVQRPETANSARETVKPRIADGGIGRSADAASPTEETLRKRVAELERTKTALDKKVADQGKRIEELKSENADRDSADAALWKKIADQDAKLATLEARIAESGKRHDESKSVDKPASGIDGRDREAEGDPDRAKPTRGRHLPTDAAIGFGAAVASGAEFAVDHTRYIPPEYAGIGAAVLGIGVTGAAWLRERRKEKNADHRSKD